MVLRLCPFKHDVFCFRLQLDTPATLGCQSENVTMTSRTVLFRAECKEKNKKFELHLNLKEEIDPEVREMLYTC